MKPDGLAKLEEAKRLMELALALLDEAGELRAAPNLDLAIHQLSEALQGFGAHPGKSSMHH
jgi:hypothetical protein